MKTPLIILLILVYSCKTQFVQQERTYVSKSKLSSSNLSIKSNTTFYFIRHAEPLKEDTSNPSLSTKGLKKAQLYARFFKGKKVDTVFTTNLKRTVETASVIAKAKAVKMTYYNPFDLDFNTFLEEHKSNSLVIVGHSNTTPDFVNKIIKEVKYTQMLHDNYSSIYKIVLINGKVIYDEILNIEDEIQKMEDAKLSPKELNQVLKARKKVAKLKSK